MGSDLLYMIQPRWRPAIQFGTSTMCSRSHNRYAERFAYEKKVWAPFAESLAKDGSRTGWSLNARVFPSGANTPFQAVTVDIVRSWKEIFQPSGDFANSFRKSHPDMELSTTFEQYEKLRTIISTNVFHLDDDVSAAK